MVWEKKGIFDKEGDACGNGSALHDGTDRGRPEKAPQSADERGWTRGEVAEFLVNDIKKAMRQGYSLQEIKDVLAQSGISVSLAKMQEVLAKSDVVGESSLPKKTEADITCCPAKDTLASVPEASPPTMAFNDTG